VVWERLILPLVGFLFCSGLVAEHLTGPWFFAWKTSLALVNFDTANARLCTARLTMMLMKQKIKLLAGVKNNIVLEERWLTKSEISKSKMQSLTALACCPSLYGARV